MNAAMKSLRQTYFLCIAILAFLVVAPAFGEQRFPPPDFDNGYSLPTASTPNPRLLSLQYVDAALFWAALGIAVWMIYKRRSRQ